MKRLFTTLVISILFLAGSAEDIIVMRSGDVVRANVLEIGQSEIKYKKASNPNGPMYTVSKDDVLSISYENGETDRFEQPTPDESEQKVQTTGTIVKAPDGEINRHYLEKISPDNVQFVGTPTDKQAEQIVLLYKPDEGSVLSDENLEVLIYSTGNVTTFNEPHINIILNNKSAKTLYVDLANCFLVCDGVTTSYYTPTVTSTTNTRSGGVGVNLGAVAGALGIGGPVGTIASGVNIGGSSGISTSTMTFSERILRLPPMSTYTLENAVMPKQASIKDSGLDYGRTGIYQRLTYQKPRSQMLTEGEIRFDFEKEIFPKISSTITYSSDEQFSVPVIFDASYSPYKMIAGKIKKKMDLRFMRESDYSPNLKNTLFIALIHRDRK